jgi:hypothetical protein
MLRCDECACVSEVAKGWVAYLSIDPDDPDDEGAVVMYCPPCAFREFEVQKLVAADYI